MRLVRFAKDGVPTPGRIEGEQVVDLSAVAPTIESIIADGLGAEAADADGPRTALADVRLLAPLQPASLRDFLAFEDHAKAGAARRNEELDQRWYQIPVYYKGNHRSILGPDEPLRWPPWTEKLDFECEIACIVGTGGSGLDEDEAAAAIFGYTIMNDWSARDLQRAEMAMRLGPARSKDFATSLGPCIVTADEFDPADGLAMRVMVDGEVWFETAAARMHWTFPQMISYVSAGEQVYPCDLYGSGTAFGGCGLDQNRWLPRRATVELSVEGIGSLRTVLTEA